MIQCSEARFAYEFAGILIPRNQDAGFLEGFANGGHRHRLQPGVPDGNSLSKVADLGIEVARRCFAAGKHQRAGSELDLMVSPHHKDLQPRIPITQKENRRGGNGFTAFGQGTRSFHGTLTNATIPNIPFRERHSPRTAADRRWKKNRAPASL